MFIRLRAAVVTTFPSLLAACLFSFVYIEPLFGQANFYQGENISR